MDVLKFRLWEEEIFVRWIHNSTGAPVYDNYISRHKGCKQPFWLLRQCVARNHSMT